MNRRDLLKRTAGALGASLVPVSFADQVAIPEPFHPVPWGAPPKISWKLSTFGSDLIMSEYADGVLLRQSVLEMRRPLMESTAEQAQKMIESELFPDERADQPGSGRDLLLEDSSFNKRREE